MSQTTFLPPTAATTGFYTNESDRIRDRKDCVESLLLAGRIDDDTRQVQQEVCNSGHHVTGAVDRAGLESRLLANSEGLETRREVRDEGHETRDRVHLGDAETRGLIKNFGEKNLDSTERFGLFTRDAVDRNLRAIDEEGCKTREMVADYGYRNLLESKDMQKEMLKDGCLTREVVKDRSSILERQAADNFAVVTRQAAENKCAIELMAFKHAADLQRQISECCCEMKELVIEKADATDKLIREVDSNRIRDALSDAKAEIIALKIRGGLAPAPVSAIAL